MRKQLVRNLIIVLACLVVLSGSVIATYPPTVYLNDLPSTASYVIKTDGTNYWSVRSDGYTSASSTNATYIVNSALSAASTAGGGTVLLTSGSYIASDYEAGFVWYNNTRLLGENRDSVFLINNRGAGTGKLPGLLRNQHCTNASYGTPSATWVRDANFTLESITLIGKRSAGKYGFGFSIFNADNVRIKDVCFSGFAADTINFNGLSSQQGGMGQSNGTSLGVFIESSSIKDAGIDGIAFNWVSNFFITNYNCSYFSQLGSGTNNGWGITLYGCSYGSVDNFLIQHSTEISVGGQGAGGIHASDPRWVTFSNGWISNVNGTGFFMESDVTNPQYCSTVNLHVVNSTSENVLIKNGYDLNFANVICLNAGYGSAAAQKSNFYLFNTERSRLVGAELRDNQGTPTTYYGIKMSGGCDYTTLSSIYINGYGAAAPILSDGIYDIDGVGFRGAGLQATCINGTTIAHGLIGTPTSVSLTMYGQNCINSTCWYLDPSVYSMNATHVVICFTLFNAGTITAVAAPNSRTLYWMAAYAP